MLELLKISLFLLTPRKHTFGVEVEFHTFFVIAPDGLV
jgi:hypothetical protein